MGFRIRQNAADGQPFWVQATGADRIEGCGFVGSHPNRKSAQESVDYLTGKHDNEEFIYNEITGEYDRPASELDE